MQSPLSHWAEHDQSLAFRFPLFDQFPHTQLFLVGGMVRDLLLKRKVGDIDIVIRGISRENLEGFLGSHGKLDLVGASFGVYKFIPRGEIAEIDIAFPRSEQSTEESHGGYKDFDIQIDPGLPMEKDLARRDFTVNAIAYDIKKGELIDPFNGQADLEAKLIRAVGNAHERFREDYSRLLRAMRFAAELGFTLETATARSLQEEIAGLHKTMETPEGKGVYVIAREIVGKELAKLFKANPVYGAELLHFSGALASLFPELLEVYENDPHFIDPLKRYKGADLTVILSLFLRSVGAERALAILKRNGLTTLPSDGSLRVEEAHVGWIVEKLSHPPDRPHDSSALDIERTYMNPRGERYLAALHALEHENRVTQARERIRDICSRWICKPGEPIPELISGSDILSQGVEPGPEIRVLLDKIRDAQLSGLLMNRSDALAHLAKLTQTKNPD